jgi:subtilisin
MSRSWPTRDECLRAMLDGDGSGVKVAILDTGVDPRHPDFKSLRLAGTWGVEMGGGNPVVRPLDGKDPAGHGTAIAGIIHALAPAAEILGIAILGGDQRQHRHEIIRAGAGFALEQGAAILNCSFGVPGTGYTLPIYKAWTDEAFHRDRIVVAASSNHAPELPSWPAFFAQVIGVTACEGGSCEPVMTTPRHHVTIAAPGAGITVPVPGGGRARVTGSSFAAAHVSGLLARLMSRFPGLTPSMAREALEHHAAGG